MLCGCRADAQRIARTQRSTGMTAELTQGLPPDALNDLSDTLSLLASRRGMRRSARRTPRCSGACQQSATLNLYLASNRCTLGGASVRLVRGTITGIRPSSFS